MWHAWRRHSHSELRHGGSSLPLAGEERGCIEPTHQCWAIAMAAAAMAVCDFDDLDRMIYTFDLHGCAPPAAAVLSTRGARPRARARGACCGARSYVVIRQAIATPIVARMNELIDRVAAASPLTGSAAFFQQPVADGGQGDRFGFSSLASLHPLESRLFAELMADERALGALRVLIGDWCRLDHAYGIEMASSWGGRENLHGGARTDQGRYRELFVCGVTTSICCACWLPVREGAPLGERRICTRISPVFFLGCVVI